MIDFKFPCPNCGQRIQATDAYSGRQIQCPACQKYMVVPLAPGATAAPPPIAFPPIAPAQAKPAAPSAQRAAPPGRKSRTAWILVGSAAGLLGVGAVAWVLLSGVLSHGDSQPAARADAKATKRHDSGGRGIVNSQGPNATEIMQKVAEQYGSLTNLSASGTAVSLMDMSKVAPKNLPGMNQMPGGAKNTKAVQQALSKPIRSESAISVKMGRPNLYLVEWDGTAGPVAMKGAVWCAGEGDYLSTDKTKYTRMDSRELALASATGVSGGAAGTLPSIFFNGQSGVLSLVQKSSRAADETVDGEDCYVVKGDAMGMSVALWITKTNFLLKQKQIVLGGKTRMPDMNDGQMEEGLKKLGNLSPAQKAQAKAAMKNMKPMLAQTKGTMTETYRDLEINQPVKTEDFKHDMPAGAKLSASLFAN
jgi:DNA-directed RNA polymerase subunit RPC12/RpoP